MYRSIKNQIDVKTVHECTQAENGRTFYVNWQREEFEREIDERLAQWLKVKKGKKMSSGYLEF